MVTSDTFVAEGGCACGAVHFRLTATPLIVHCCHCRWCQRESGAAFALNAMIETDHVIVMRGEPEPVEAPTNSGKGQLFVRCPSCKVALWSHYGGLSDDIASVRVGTLDEPDQMPPDVHIFTASKQPWLRLPEGTPVFEAYYDVAELWPEDSLRRWNRLMKTEET